MLAIDPITPGTLYVGTGNYVYKSTDGGGSWIAVERLINSFLALAVDPTTPGTVYAGTNGRGIFKSTNGGTWNAASTALSNSSVSVLVLDPTSPGVLYAGTDGGVFESTNAGATWSALNTGLPAVGASVSALAPDPTTPGTLYAGTNGGVFSIQQVAVCIGDCTGTHTVAVNHVITLVNIALDSAQPAACSNGGLPIGGDVNVAVITQAVNNALNGCGAGK